MHHTSFKIPLLKCFENYAHLSLRASQTTICSLWELQMEKEAFCQSLILSIKNTSLLCPSVYHKTNVDRKFWNYKAAWFKDTLNFALSLLQNRCESFRGQKNATISRVGHFCGEATSLFLQLNSYNKNLLIDSADGSQRLGLQYQKAHLCRSVWVVRLFCHTGRLVLQRRPCHHGCVCIESTHTHITHSQGLGVRLRVGVIYEHFQHVPDKFSFSVFHREKH